MGDQFLYLKIGRDNIILEEALKFFTVVGSLLHKWLDLTGENVWMKTNEETE